MVSPPILDEFMQNPLAFIDASRVGKFLLYLRITQMEWFYRKMEVYHPYIDCTYDRIGLALLRNVLGFWPTGVVGSEKQLGEGLKVVKCTWCGEETCYPFDMNGSPLCEVCSPCDRR